MALLPKFCRNSFSNVELVCQSLQKGWVQILELPLEQLNVKPIPTGLCHVITIYGLIQPISGKNRVKIM